MIKLKKAPTEHSSLDFCILLLNESSYGAILRWPCKSRTTPPLFKTNRLGRADTVDDRSWNQKHQHPKQEGAQIDENHGAEMQFNRHSGEIIGGSIQFDQPRVLLQKTKTQTYDIAYEHAYEQDAQRTTQKHLANEFVAGTHSFQQTDGRSALNNDNQQHTDDRDACHQ